MKKNVLITGATGFLGSYLLKQLLDNDDITPIVLARDKKGEKAAARVHKTLKYFYGDDASKTMMKRVKIVDAHIDKKYVILDHEMRELLIEEVDEIYHSAAIAEFRIPLDKIRKTNVEGTRHMLEFAMQCKENGHFKKFNHISTTFVVGTRPGVFHEDELDVKQKFNNTYEQSKYEAELVVHEYMQKGLDATIFRPSILTGDSMTGKTSNFKMLYQPLHFFAAELFPAIPADRGTQFNLIPVDAVAEEIGILADDDESPGKTYHIAHASTVSAGQFIDIASDFFGFRAPQFIPLKDFDMTRLTVVQKSLIGPYIPYFNYKTSFDTTKAKRILDRVGFRCPMVDEEVLLKLFKYCADTGFIKRKRQHVIAG